MKRTLTARSFHFSCNGKLTRVACSQASVFSSSAHGISWSRYSHHAKSENDHGYVRIEQDGTEQGVFVVKLNRPDKLNALSVDVGNEFREKIGHLRHNADLRCVVLTGEGKAFSAGGDLDFLMERTKTKAEKNVGIMLEFYKRFLSIRSLDVPVITGINGPAVGAGLCLALATDLRITSPETPLSFNFSKLGLHPGMAATHFLPLVVGPQVATRLLVTGETFNGEQAFKYGLIAELVAKEKVLERAVELARSIASTVSPSTVGMILKTLRGQQEEGLERALLREADGQAHSYASPDLLEGLAAIKEKRPPTWK